jgi:hypothetical protein
MDLCMHVCTFCIDLSKSGHLSLPVQRCQYASSCSGAAPCVCQPSKVTSSSLYICDQRSSSWPVLGVITASRRWLMVAGVTTWQP